MKPMLFLPALLIITSTCFCQTFMHGAGVTLIVSSAKNSDVTIAEGLTYFPRINFLETESLSASVGIPLSIAVSGSYSTYYSNSGGNYSNGGAVGVVVNVPLIVNLNMGRGSTKDNTDRYGYFIGAGFGYHHGDFISTQTDGNSNYSGSQSINSFGPAANAGFRIGVGRAHRNIEIRLSYMKGVNENKANLSGLAGSFNF
jgi:hypothetical protein